MERLVKLLAPYNWMDYLFKLALFLLALGAINHLRDALTADGELKSFAKNLMDATFVGFPFAILSLSLVKYLNDLQRELQRLALTDSLTGLPNRRAFMSMLEDELAATGVRSSLLLIDIDHFKRVNDTYGHAAGDEALVAFSGLLRKTIGQNHHVGRLGGEEFAIVMRNTAPAEVDRHAQQIVAGIMLYPPLTDRPKQLTCSIGATQLFGAHTPSTALRDADIALYAAKKRGRARVVHATDLDAEADRDLHVMLH